MGYIYVVEQGTLMNGCEWEYNVEYHATSLDKAKDYIESYFKEFVYASHQYEPGEDGESLEKPPCVITEVNSVYWRCEVDYDTRIGIQKVELDQEYWWRES